MFQSEVNRFVLKCCARGREEGHDNPDGLRWHGDSLFLDCTRSWRQNTALMHDPHPHPAIQGLADCGNVSECSPAHHSEMHSRYRRAELRTTAARKHGPSLALEPGSEPGASAGINAAAAGSSLLGRRFELWPSL
jgi:hypothetical protein